MEQTDSYPEEDYLPDDSEIAEAEVEIFEVPVQEEKGAFLDFQLSFLDAPSEPEPPRGEYRESGQDGPPPRALPSSPPSPRRKRAVGKKPVSETGAGSETRARPRFKPMPTLQLPAVGMVRRAFSIFFGAPLPFLAIAALASFPQLLLQLGIVPPGAVVFLVRWLFPEIVASTFLGVTAYVVFQLLRESGVGTGEAFGNGLRRFAPVAVVAILVFLATYCGIVPAIAAAIVGFHPITSFLIFVPIPALAAYCVFLVAVPACVVERLGPIDAVRRSMELTKGFRGAIFWIVLIWFWYCIGLYLFVRLAMGVTGLVQFPLVAWGADFLLTISVLAVKNILIALVYYELRRIKDNMPVADMGRVFG